MKKRIAAMVLMLSMMVTLFAWPVSAMQDPVYFLADTVTYGEWQNTLVVKGWFVNASNRTIISLDQVRMEVKEGGTLIASKSFDIASQKSVSLSVGNAVPWELTFENPVQNMPLTAWKTDSMLTYNTGQKIDLDFGKKIYYRGAPVVFDVKPAVINGRLMIPARAVFEKMGATVMWNAESRSMEVSRGDRTVIIFIGNPIMTVNGSPTKLDVSAAIVDGRTLVPLRAIATALGATVTYGEENEMAIIIE